MSNGVIRIKNAEMAKPKTPKGTALKTAMKSYNSSLKSITGNEKQKKGK